MDNHFGRTVLNIEWSTQIKGARSDHFRFFFNFRKCWYPKKVCIFLITHVKFYGGKMYRLEDINENVTSYGNHN